MSRRIHALSLTALLLAAQATVLMHAVDHALSAGTDPCVVCHAADHFKHALTGSHAAVSPQSAASEFTPVPFPVPGNAITRAFLARAPPAVSC